MWNEPAAKFPFQGEEYQVYFDVQGAVVDTEDNPLLVAYNKDFANNFIRIENSNRLTRSMMGNGLGDNSGHWLSTDQLGQSSTAAHEFGHALGLPHPNKLDYRGEAAPPPIMAPRDTWVDADFQWNPKVNAGETGGTMHPKYRKVRATEIIEVLKPLNKEKRDRVNLGKISNTVYDQMANPLLLT